MSWLNDRLEGPLRKAQANPHYRPIIDEIENVQTDGVSSDEIARTAVKATRDVYVRENRKLDLEDIRYDAYLAASAAALEKPYQLSDAPEGPDKSQHLFVSGTISAKIDQWLDNLRIIPGPVRRFLGVSISVTLGFFKEVADIFTSGFNRDDLKADWKGARSPFGQPLPASR